MTLTPEKANWIDLINESVHTSDEVDIGHINAVSRDFIVVKRALSTYNTIMLIVAMRIRASSKF